MKKILYDKMTIKRTITRICHEIIENNKGLDDLVLAGIKTRGVFIAKRFANIIQEIEGVDIPVVELDITNFRDDINDMPVDFVININLNNKTVVIVDDVLFTGRSTRAALDSILTSFRPKKILLAALIDRGHRELPIKADFVGKNVPTSLKEKIQVKLTEVDDIDVIYLINE